MPYHRKAAFAAATTGLIVLNGCITPPHLPDRDQAAYPDPNLGFAQAIPYAYDTQYAYNRWLDDEVQFNMYAGVTEIALAGSALGLGAVGGAKTAVTALGTAAGATISLDQFVVGSPAKDPRFTAYASGIARVMLPHSQLQRRRSMPIWPVFHCRRPGSPSASPLLRQVRAAPPQPRLRRCRQSRR